MSAVTFKHLLFDICDGVAVLTLNRPDRLNAVNTEMVLELAAAFDITDHDDDVRAVVLTGAGRAFCAGADLSSDSGAFDQGHSGSRSGRDTAGVVALRVYRSLKPVIAAINGAAVGFGASLTLPADFRLAADGAKLGFPFGARGIIPDGTSSWFLPRIVGVPRAVDWLLTARMFDSREALESGLVRSLHPAEEVLPAALDLAGVIARDVSPQSAVLTRHLVWSMLGASHPMEAHRFESVGLAHATSGPDAREGVEAFLEKRVPTWPVDVSKRLPNWFPWMKEPPYESSWIRDR